MVNETASGYICIFSVHSEKGQSDLLTDHILLDADYPRYLKTGLGLLHEVQLMATGKHVYFGILICLSYSKKHFIAKLVFVVLPELIDIIHQNVS